MSNVHKECNCCLQAKGSETQYFLSDRQKVNKC